MVKFELYNLRQIICACKNYMEALLEENKKFVSDHCILTFAQLQRHSVSHLFSKSAWITKGRGFYPFKFHNI